VNLWFAAAVLVAALAALLLAGWLSTRISAPVEARIAIGDLARQVNHDVKNGLAPLRNVFRHLTQVARDAPAELPKVFARTPGHGRIEYQLSRDTCRELRQVVAAVRAQGDGCKRAGAGDDGASGAVRTKLADGLPPVSADALVLRRVIENLVSNALDSFDGKAGTVTVTTEGGKGVVRIAVSDTGRGMSKAELDRAFNDFYTTKAGGRGSASRS